MDHIFEELPSGYEMTVYLPNDTEVRLEISKLTERHETLSGILIVEVSTPERDSRLFVGRFNLLAERSRPSLAKKLEETAPATLNISKEDWHKILEKFCQLAIEKYYTPEPLERIKPAETSEVDFLIKPILPKGHPVLIYAPGGSGKSLLAMHISMVVQNGLKFDSAHTEAVKGNVLYVDWEVDKREAERRYAMLLDNYTGDLTNNIDDELEFPFYKRATLPLKDEIDDILAVIKKHDISLVIMDSAGPALGGDINNAEKVIELFGHIRKITSYGATVLLLTHVSKAEKDEDTRTPLGSVYFENLSRLTWELKVEVIERDKMNLALIPRKSNFGHFDPIGLTVIFKYGRVYFESLNPEVIGDSSTKDLILSTLQSCPEGKTLAELRRLLGLRTSQLSNALNRLQKQKLVINEGGIWKIAPSKDSSAQKPNQASSKNEEKIDLSELLDVDDSDLDL